MSRKNPPAVSLTRLSEFVNTLLQAAQRIEKPNAKLQDFVKNVKGEYRYIKAADFLNLSPKQQATFALLALLNSAAYKIKLVDTLNGGALAIFFYTDATSGFAYNTQLNTSQSGVSPNWNPRNYKTYTYNVLDVLLAVLCSIQIHNREFSPVKQN